MKLDVIYSFYDTPQKYELLSFSKLLLADKKEFFHFENNEN